MPLTYQIAGHGSEKDGHRPFLKYKNGKHLMKPFQDPPKGVRELEFYTNLQTSEDPSDLELKKFVPKFFGLEKVIDDNDQVDNEAEMRGSYLVLEDLK